MAALPGLAEVPDDARTHAVLAARLPRRRGRPRTAGHRFGRTTPRAGRGFAARGARAHRAHARSTRGSGGSTCAPARAARPLCSPPRRCATGHPRCERDLARPCGSRAAGARGCSRSTSRSVGGGRRASRADRTPGDVRPHPRRCALHGARRTSAPPRGALAEVARRCSRAHRSCRANCSTSACRAPSQPGGIVAYVTCSPHLAETVGVVSEVRASGRARSRARRPRGDVATSRRADSTCPPQSDGVRSGAALAAPTRHRRHVDHAPAPPSEPPTSTSQSGSADGIVLELRAERPSAAGWARASSRASTDHDRVVRQRFGEFASTADHSLRPREAEFAAEVQTDRVPRSVDAHAGAAIALVRLEDVHPELARHAFEDLDASDAVAVRVQTRAERRDAELRRRDREQCRRSRRSWRGDHAQQPLAGVVVHPAARHDRERHRERRLRGRRARP